MSYNDDNVHLSLPAALLSSGLLNHRNARAGMEATTAVMEYDCLDHNTAGPV
jgi:hypothetical protein